MAETGWKLAGTGANEVLSGSTNWSNPGNIAIDDTTNAQSNPAKGGNTAYLNASNFGFSLGSATVQGIEAKLTRYRDSGSTTIYDYTIQLLVGGTRSGSNKADTTTNWPTAAADVVYGGDDDLWGLSLTSADVDGSDFGLSIRVGPNAGITNRLCYISHVWLNVTYEPAGNPGAFFALFSVKDRLRDILKPKRGLWLPEPAII
jgi:hypothetical protein